MSTRSPGNHSTEHLVRVLAFTALSLTLVLFTNDALGQEHHAAPAAASSLPTQSGQDAFAAISELVRILEADPRTDWSRVNLEAVRQHLIDMNDVVLRSAVRTTTIPGGATFTISAPAPVSAAIARMVAMHALELEKLPPFQASAKPTADGAVLTVVARSPGDSATTTRIRGLGFIGLLATGAHHQEHHLALATGGSTHGHH
jgi:hypothetical protein